MSNKLYDVLKWLVILFIPALATLYRGIAGIWDLPFAEDIPQTLIEIDAFLGAIIGLSTIDYNQKKKAELEEARRLNAQDL